ncbi:phosphonate C-P lyase system protein PhnH [Paenibacillus alkalitolerans]|uniref:phosphonate C-P lyase system protein PhnH n=1 Tax=Paenibacillus alkalitolerans TaxID=2799335 RepID=UPI0018F67D58|nr:phosphonate C-P lyase system protein PhnH [Paenibacillus alkalitolerans]
MESVHETQFIYRALLDSIAYPGTVRDIRTAILNLNPASAAGFCPAAAGIALTLLDGEVGHAVRMKDSSELSDYVRRMTFSPAVPLNKADYVFADGDMSAEEIIALSADVKCGTHEAPDLGATLFIKVETLGDETARGRRLTLSGPGIETEKDCIISGLSPEWLAEREKMNAEYPVGIDLFLFTGKGDIIALPRTAKIKEVDR